MEEKRRKLLRNESSEGFGFPTSTKLNLCCSFVAKSKRNIESRLKEDEIATGGRSPKVLTGRKALFLSHSFSVSRKTSSNNSVLGIVFKLCKIHEF